MAESPQEVLLGKLALTAGLITEDQLEDCRVEVRTRAEAGGDRPSLAQLLVERGYATQGQLVNLAKNAAREMTAGARPSSDPEAGGAAAPAAVVSPPAPASESAGNGNAPATTPTPAPATPAPARASAQPAASLATADNSNGSGGDRGAAAARGSGSAHNTPAVAVAPPAPSVAPAKQVAQSQGGSSPIEGYEIVSKIGAGAMGAVYKARQISMDRIVALKVLPPKLARNKQYIDRFLREARAAARLNHENIVGAFDIGECNGLYYFAMEFVEGTTVKDLLAEKKALQEREALELVRQVAMALSHASEQGIVHRDIKPDNIMITSDGVAKLCDMGLAKQVEGDAAITMAGAAVGTPWYISPEQARGKKEVDTRADIYSLGCTLFHMICGGPPYIGPTAAVIMTKHINDAIPDPRRSKSYLTDGIVKIQQGMMAKDPSDRYQRPEDVIADIDAHLAGQEVAGPRGARSASPSPSPARGSQAPASDIRSSGSARPAPPQRGGAARGSQRSPRVSPSPAPGPVPHASSRRPGRATSGMLSGGSVGSGGSGNAPRRSRDREEMMAARGGGGSGVVIFLIVVVVLVVGGAGVMIAMKGPPPVINTPDPGPIAPVKDINSNTNVPVVDHNKNTPDTDPNAAKARKWAEDQLKRVLELESAGQYEEAMNLCQEVELDNEVKKHAADLVLKARTERERIGAAAERMATDELAKIARQIEDDELIDGRSPDFRKALALMDGFPANLRFTEIAQRKLPAGRQTVVDAAETWFTQPLVPDVESLCAEHDFAGARDRVESARKILPEDFATRLGDLLTKITDAEKAWNAEQEAMRDSAVKVYTEWFATTIEPLLIARKYIAARDAVQKASEENSQFRLNEWVTARLKRDIVMIQDMQAFVGAGLIYCKNRHEAREEVQLSWGGPKMLILECEPISGDKLPSFPADNCKLRFHVRGASSTKNFSELKDEELYMLGVGGLALNARDEKGKCIPEASYLAYSYDFNTAADRGSAVLDRIASSKLGELLHPRAKERLDAMVGKYLEALLGELDKDWEKFQTEAVDAKKKRLATSLKAAYESVLERHGSAAWLNAGGGKRKKEIEDRLAELSKAGAAPPENVSKLRELFKATEVTEDGKRATIDYRFETARETEDFKAGPGSEPTWDSAEKSMKVESPAADRTNQAPLTKVWWFGQPGTDFELNIEVAVESGWEVAIGVYDKGGQQQYHIPVKGEADLGQFPRQARDALRNVSELPFGIYKGEWNILRLQELVTDRNKMFDRDFWAGFVANESISGRPGKSVSDGQTAKLKIKVKNGVFNVELNGQRLSGRDKDFTEGAISIYVVNGAARVKRFTFEGELDQKWLDAQK
ncbi:MAG: protein kinase [Planctomycetota bacterium]